MHKILQLNLFQRIFTDVDLYDPTFRRRIDHHIQIIEEFIDSNHISIPDKTDLVLDINLDTDGTYETCYYFANHQLRIIFFLDHFSSEFIPNWGEIEGVNSGRHLRMFLVLSTLECFVYILVSRTWNRSSVLVRNLAIIYSSFLTVSNWLNPGHRWHCLSYPDAFQLTDDLVCEFRAIVMHYIGG